MSAEDETINAMEEVQDLGGEEEEEMMSSLVGAKEVVFTEVEENEIASSTVARAEGAESGVESVVAEAAGAAGLHRVAHGTRT